MLWGLGGVVGVDRISVGVLCDFNWGRTRVLWGTLECSAYAVTKGCKTKYLLLREASGILLGSRLYWLKTFSLNVEDWSMGNTRKVTPGARHY